MISKEVRTVAYWLGIELGITLTGIALLAVIDFLCQSHLVRHLFQELRLASFPIGLGLGTTVPMLVTGVWLQLWCEQKSMPRHDFDDSDMPQTALGNCISAAGLGALEEFICRGILLTTWLDAGGAIIGRGFITNALGVSMAAAVFGAAHLLNRGYWGDVVRTSIHGLVLGLVVVWSGSLWPAIVMHACSNLVGELPPVNRYLERLRQRNLERHRDPYEERSSWYV